MKLKKFALLFLCLLSPSKVALAQDDNNYKFLSISVENDNFGGGTDRFYTSGVRATWFDSDITVPPVINLMADRIPTFDLNENTATFYSFGHNIYHPRRYKNLIPTP